MTSVGFVLFEPVAASTTQATRARKINKLNADCVPSPQRLAPGDSIPHCGHAFAAVLTCAPHSRQGLRAIPTSPSVTPEQECNLKEVTLKETIASIPFREEDTQGTAAGRAGQEHAPAARHARAHPGGAGPTSAGSTGPTSAASNARSARVDRQHSANREGAANRAVEVLRDE
jgi:hypothetical protein